MLRVRCGNPDCRGRAHGPPLAKAHIICMMRIGLGKGWVRCPRCGAMNVAKKISVSA